MSALTKSTQPICVKGRFFNRILTNKPPQKSGGASGKTAGGGGGGDGRRRDGGFRWSAGGGYGGGFGGGGGGFGGGGGGYGGWGGHYGGYGGWGGHYGRDRRYAGRRRGAWPSFFFDRANEILVSLGMVSVAGEVLKVYFRVQEIGAEKTAKELWAKATGKFDQHSELRSVIVSSITQSINLAEDNIIEEVKKAGEEMKKAAEEMKAVEEAKRSKAKAN